MNAPIKPSAILSDRSFCWVARNWTPSSPGKVERFFRSVEQLLLQDTPGYAPKGSTGVKAILTLPAFEQRFRTWLLEDYHHRVHVETQCRPQERWDHRVSAHSDDFTDQEAVATILRITRGNICLIERLMMQVEHVLVANQLTVVTKEVVETARKNLIIGPD
jgi:hypothetical protein